ncbi:MAG: M12 family metallopeptidase [Legionellaceae bacterium]|nr:M12 family metallopeptidase [Legionellaceae bacterium]
MMRFCIACIGYVWLSIALASVLPQGMLVEPSEGAVWPHGIVPYKIDETLPKAQKDAATEAMALWEAHTVVRFLPLTADNEHDFPDYVLLMPASGKTCASSVGRQGGVQVLRLASRCHTMLVAHELGHLLGLWHEQARLDRDLYVDVLWENIRDDHYHNFNQRVGEGYDKGPYDYDSIMHYSETAFSKNGKPTIVPRVPGVKVGQRTHLSAGDIASVNALYLSETGR